MQSAFFKIANVIPFDKAVEQMKKAIQKSYGKKGEDIVNMNYAAVDAGGDAVVKVEIPAEWASIEDKGFVHVSDASCPEFVRKIVEPINGLKGDDLPVSAFTGREDGTWENGTAAYEKRGIAVNVPEWKIENCIQCNQCAYVCPHAVIRPFLRNGDRSSRFGRRVEAGAGRDEGLQVPHPDFAARLYGLQQLRGRLPRQGEGAGDETARIAAAPAEELGLYRNRISATSEVVDKTQERSRTCSSHNRSSSSQAPAQAAARLPISRLFRSCSARR